ncbi:hypothetical protein [Demequina aestuarii]|uniref:hypothetical protein n=1 Tax=Demequina aestuarii TaxID=327095 RepID=UPI00078032A7|nr:hypothetical protein [Demequina aestuarii]
MIFLVVFAVPAVAGLVALAYGLVWLTRPDARADVARRYPLRTLTWLMAVPGGLASAAAAFFGIGFALDGGFSDGFLTDVVGRFAMPTLGLFGLVCAIAVIVVAHRVASPHRRSRPWLMLAFGAAPVLLVFVIAAASLAADSLGALSGLVLALGATTNALMAVASAAVPSTPPLSTPLPPTTPPAPPLPK